MAANAECLERNVTPSALTVIRVDLVIKNQVLKIDEEMFN